MGRSRDDHPCAGCRYLFIPAGSQDSLWKLCNYWEDVGHRRPCKPGAECTVREQKKRRRKRRLDNKYKGGEEP